MPYQKPAVLTERTGLPGTPLGNTNFFVPVVIAKTLGVVTNLSRTATSSGDEENIYINGQMVQVDDTLTYDRVTYTNGSKVTSAIVNLPVVDILSVSTDHTNPNKREYVEGTDFTVNKTSGVLSFTDASVILPPELDGLTEGTGGSIAAGTYDFAVMAVDANGNLTTANTDQLVVVAGSASVLVQWGKVRNASGYKVYTKASTDTSAQWALHTEGTISSGVTTSVTLTSAIAAGVLSVPAANATKHTPADGDYVYISYTYSVYNYDAPQRFFDTESLQQAHGIGSEISNAGRLVMGPAGVGNAAGSMYAVAPRISNGEIVGFQDAIAACESIQELVLIASSSSSDTVNETLKAHCEDMSSVENAKERFCLVGTTSAVMSNTDVTTLTDKIFALGGSNRAIYVVTDGGQPHVDAWQNTVDKYNSIAGVTKTTPYTTNQAVSGPWHAIATMGMIANLTDPAVPPTNKQVLGISSGVEGTVALWNDAKKDTVAAAGGLVLEDRYNNLFIRHGLTVSQASVEDSEISIVLAEAYMAKVLRDNHQKFIGDKLTDALIVGVAKTVNDSLTGLVADDIIRRFTNPNVFQDTVNPTWVYVLFNYFPIYPTNVIKFEWGFDIAG